MRMLVIHLIIALTAGIVIRTKFETEYTDLVGAHLEVEEWLRGFEFHAVGLLELLGIREVLHLESYPPEHPSVQSTSLP